MRSEFAREVTDEAFVNPFFLSQVCSVGAGMAARVSGLPYRAGEVDGELYKASQRGALFPFSSSSLPPLILPRLDRS